MMGSGTVPLSFCPGALLGDWGIKLHALPG